MPRLRSWGLVAIAVMWAWSSTIQMLTNPAILSSSWDWYAPFELSQGIGSLLVIACNSPEFWFSAAIRSLSVNFRTASM